MKRNSTQGRTQTEDREVLGVGRSGRQDSVRVRCQGKSGLNNFIDRFSDLGLMFLPIWLF